MGGFSVINLVPSACISFCERWGSLATTSSLIYPLKSIQTSTTSYRIMRSHPICFSKESDFQDFQGYAKPSRLLPSTGASSITKFSPLEMLSTFGADESRSAYIVKLTTSGVFGSCLSDMNAGILLCLIDKNGDSLLQRVAASLKDEEASQNSSCFQRGSTDEFIFEGPKMGEIEAVWIGLDSGRWRLGDMSLITISGSQPESIHSQEEEKFTPSSCLKYYFEAEDILLGDATDMSMVELRPCLVTELSGDSSSSLETSLSLSTSVLTREISNEESMKEYADLKLSLLIYDTILIFAGSSITNVTIGDKATLAFLIGGIGGLLYLLLLQRSVDGLPAPTSNSSEKDGNKKFEELLGGLKGPILSLGLVFGFALATVKYSSETASVVLTPKEIIIGMTGFLVCKVAVVLAAIKPMTTKLK